MKAIQINSEVTGPRATVCPECGSPMEEIGLVAPKCTGCGKFNLDHLTFLPPVDVELPNMTIIVEEA